MDEFEEMLAEPAPATALEQILAKQDQIRAWKREGKTIKDIAAALGFSQGRLSQLKKHPQVAEILNTPVDPPPGVEPTETATYTGEPIGHHKTLAWIEERVAQGVGLEAIAVLLGLDSAAEFEKVARDKPRVARAVRVGKARREELAAGNLARIMNDPGHRDHARVSQYMARCSGPHWAPINAPTKEAAKPPVEDETLLTPAEIMSRLRGPDA